MLPRYIYNIFTAVLFCLSLLLAYIASFLPYKIESYFLIFAFSLVILSFLKFFFTYQFYKGLKHGFTVLSIKTTLQKQLCKAGIYYEYGRLKFVPKMIITLDEDLQTGTIKLKNSIKFNNKFDTILDLSAGLAKYKVEYDYISDDSNHYIYNIVKADTSFKISFKSDEEFSEYSRKISDYSLFLDSRSVVKVQHTLIVGQTGSGKTYALYSLLLQMKLKKIPYYIFINDPKGASLAILGDEIANGRTATNNYEICQQLANFVSEMQKRKNEIKSFLATKLDSDYSDFGFSPYIFVIDEFASFSTWLKVQPKAERDVVLKNLHELVLQGRQLGFFLFLLMQKSDATLIDTVIRENLPLKIVLGNSESQTYVTTFGHVDIPNRHYLTGEGVFTEPKIAPAPKLVEMPYLEFDILKSFTAGA